MRAVHPTAGHTHGSLGEVVEHAVAEGKQRLGVGRPSPPRPLLRVGGGQPARVYQEDRKLAALLEAAQQGAQLAALGEGGGREGVSHTCTYMCTCASIVYVHAQLKAKVGGLGFNSQWLAAQVLYNNSDFEHAVASNLIGQ